MELSPLSLLVVRPSRERIQNTLSVDRRLTQIVTIIGNMSMQSCSSYFYRFSILQERVLKEKTKMPVPLISEEKYRTSLKSVQPFFVNDYKRQNRQSSDVISSNDTHPKFSAPNVSHHITHHQIGLYEKKFYFPAFNMKQRARNRPKEAYRPSFFPEKIENHCFSEPHRGHKHHHKHEYHHLPLHGRDTVIFCEDKSCTERDGGSEILLDDVKEFSFVVKSLAHDNVIIHETPLQTTKLRVQNICCPKEARIVQEELEKLSGINTIRVNVLGRVAYISHDQDKVTPPDLLESLNKRHLGASIVEAGSEEDVERGFPRKLKILLAILVLQAVLFAVALGAMFSLKAWYKWVAIGQVCFGMLPVLKKCYHAARHKQIDLNILITVTVAGTLGIQQWIEGAAVVFIFILANFLQEYCFYRVYKTISSLMLAKPSKAVMACTGELVAIEGVSIGTYW